MRTLLVQSRRHAIGSLVPFYRISGDLQRRNRPISFGFEFVAFAGFIVRLEAH